jgi:hypothetical protein
MLDVTQYVNDNFFHTQNTPHFVVVQMEGALYVVMFHQEWVGITKCPQWNTCLCLWVFHFSKCPCYIFLPWYTAGTCLLPIMVFFSKYKMHHILCHAMPLSQGISKIVLFWEHPMLWHYPTLDTHTGIVYWPNLKIWNRFWALISTTMCQAPG